MSKRISILLLSLVCIFSFTSTSFVNTTFADSTSLEDCEECTTEKPEDTGSDEDIEQAKDVLYSSDEFKSTVDEESGHLEKEDAIVNAPDKDDEDAPSKATFITVPVEDADNNLNNVVFTVDLEEEEILDIRKTFIDVTDENQVDLKIEENGEVVSDVSIDSDNVEDNLESTKESHTDFLNEAENEDDGIQTMGSTCEDLVNTLSGAAGASQCYLLCLELGAANGIAGLSCSVVCSIALAVPLSDATDQICG